MIIGSDRIRFKVRVLPHCAAVFTIPEIYWTIVFLSSFKVLTTHYFTHYFTHQRASIGRTGLVSARSRELLIGLPLGSRGSSIWPVFFSWFSQAISKNCLKSGAAGMWICNYLWYWHSSWWLHVHQPLSFLILSLSDLVLEQLWSKKWFTEWFLCSVFGKHVSELSVAFESGEFTEIKAMWSQGFISQSLLIDPGYTGLYTCFIFCEFWKFMPFMILPYFIQITKLKHRGVQ